MTAWQPRASTTARAKPDRINAPRERKLEWDPRRGSLIGQRSIRPHRQAGYMTARTHRAMPKNPLHRGRPYMDVQRRGGDDEVRPVLLILAAPDQLRIEITVAPLVSEPDRALLLLPHDGLELRRRNVPAPGVLMGQRFDFDGLALPRSRVGHSLPSFLAIFFFASASMARNSSTYSASAACVSAALRSASNASKR